MSLNIKSERVHELAREAARRTGKSQTAVIQDALERFLAELATDSEEQARQARLDVIFSDIDVTITDADREVARRVMEEMYDERGLPA